MTIAADPFSAALDRMSAAAGRGDGEEFHHACQEILALQPGSAADALRQAEAHFLAGSCRQCLAVLRPLLADAALGADPASPLACAAALLAAKGLYELGEEDYPHFLELALAAAPAGLEATLLLAGYHLVREDFGRALHLYRRAVVLSPAPYDAMIGAAASALALGAVAEAGEWARRAIQCDAGGRRSEAHTVLAAVLRSGAPLAAFEAYVVATGRSGGARVLPTPLWEGIPEARRGLCDTLRALIRGRANLDAFVAHSCSGQMAPKQTPFTIGNLRELATLPEDGQFHPLDHDGSVASRRLTSRHVEPLQMPLNYRPVRHDGPLLKSAFINWCRAAYGRHRWHREHPFPQYFGTDGDFMTRIDGAILIEGFLFSRHGEFLEESFLFDELVFASGLCSYTPAGNGVAMMIRKLSASVHLSMPCLYLGGYHLNTRLTHYATWLFEVVPKLALFESLPETRALPIIMSRLAYDTPFVRETLAPLGIAEDRLILVAPGAITCGRLYVGQSASGMYAPRHLEWVRRRLFESLAITPPARPRRRLFLSRSDATCRRVINEAALMRCLARRGFEKVESAPLSMRERIECFSQAECVIGVSGAGLTNLLFCPPGTTAIVVFPERFIDTGYWTVINTLKLNYFVDVEPLVINEGDDFIVSLERIEALLDQAGIV